MVLDGGGAVHIAVLNCQSSSRTKTEKEDSKMRKYPPWDSHFTASKSCTYGLNIHPTVRLSAPVIKGSMSVCRGTMDGPWRTQSAGRCKSGSRRKQNGSSAEGQGNGQQEGAPRGALLIYTCQRVLLLL